LGGENPVGTTGKLNAQIAAHMEQMAINLEWAIINGAYSKATNSTSYNTTRGLITACTAGTNKVNAGTAAMTVAFMDTLMKDMADNGALPGGNKVIFVNAWQKQALTKLYGIVAFAGPQNTIGGQAVDTINTDFGTFPVVYDPFMPTTAILIADVAKLRPVFLPVPDPENGGYKGVLFYEPKPQAGAGVGGMLYTQFGIDYTAERHHGVIYGLTAA
jgi:hypothetical protein